MGGRQCIVVEIGQCGIQAGNTVWELFCEEHGLDVDGKLRQGGNEAAQNDMSKMKMFFSETKKNKFTPLSILLDLEPTVLDDVRTSSYKDLYNPEYMVSGTEDAANNFGRGFYTIGRDMLPAAQRTLRKLTEQCDSVEGFLYFHSCGGGTGSGFATLFMDHIANEFRKKERLEFAVLPAPKISNSTVEPYNAVLSLRASLAYELTTCTFYIDNESLYNISENKLSLYHPNYTTLNRLCAQAVSSITASLRFKGQPDIDLSDFKLNLAPFPILRFPIISYAPIITREKMYYEQLKVKHITGELFSPNNQLLKCDTTKGMFIACCVLYRGDVVPKDINDAIQRIKNRKSIRFVDWSPIGIKVGLNTQPPQKFPRDTEITTAGRAACLLANSTSIVELFDRLGEKFDLMFKERAFIHWFLREGVELHEFSDARKDLEILKREYIEAGSSTAPPKIDYEF